MAFDLGQTEQAFPLIRFAISGVMIWLGFNLIIIVDPPEDS